MYNYTTKILLKEAYNLRGKLQKELDADYINKTLMGHQYHIETLNNYIKELLTNNMAVTTQQFLNWLNKPATPLVEDGIIGVRSREQMLITIKKLQEEFAKRMWKWESFNFIGIRTDNDFDDTFEDWFILTSGDNHLVAVPASTVVGVTSVWKYINLWIRGRKGVGTIMENQQIDYLLVEPRGDSWTNWTGGLGFLFQDKPIDVYRGAIQEGGKWVIDKTNPVKGDIGGGFNVHSWAGFSIWNVGNLSEGCNVTRQAFWSIVFPLLVQNARLINGQKRITYSLMQF